jgi:ABC-2 type transport system permease protein
MKAYISIVRCRMSAFVQYRSAALAGFATQLFWGFIHVMILEAFYAQTFFAQPLTIQQAITFVWLGQALLHLLPWTLDKEVIRMIRSGNIAYELVRPLDLYGVWFARAIAQRVTPTLMRCFPLLLVSWLFFGLSSPVSWASGLAFLVSICFSTLLAASMTAIVSISLFWTISGEGIQRLIPHVTMVLSGMLVPLPLFPDWMQTFLSLQPFRGIIDIPNRLYTGVIPVSECIYYIGFQFAWYLFFWFFGKFLMSKATKKIVIQGG